MEKRKYVMILYEFVYCESYKNIQILQKKIKHDDPTLTLPLNIPITGA